MFLHHMKMNLKKLFGNKLILFAVTVLIGGGAFFIWNKFKGDDNGTPMYETEPVQRGNIASSVNASGNILSANIIPVTTEASGVIKDVYVNEGDEVTEGQKILDITLDQDGEKALIDAHAKYIAARNRLEEAQSRLYTLENTLREKENDFTEVKETTSYQTKDERDAFHNAENDYLAAKSDYELQRSKIEETRLSLENARLSYEALLPEVTAPTSGIITGISYIGGMRLSGEETTSGSRRGQTIASIKTGGAPLVSVNVSEIDVPLLEVAQKATVTLDSIPAKTFTGEVVTVDRVGSITSGVSNYPVIIQLDTGSKDVLSNMAATAEIIVNRKENVLAVPSSAVQERDGQTFVQVLEGGVPKFVAVKTGLESLRRVEIISGLSEGDKVITSTLSTSTVEEGGQSPFGSSGGGMMKMVK